MAGPNAIVITGGSGFLGVSLATHLIQRDPSLQIVLSDTVEHPRLSAVRDKVTFAKADLTDPSACRDLLTDDVGTVFHFAALVSGGAERDFHAGLQANLYAPLNLLEACRQQGACPRVVFPSSIATFGGAQLPEEIDDYTYQHPQNSYGAAKVAIEQLLNDYSRRGYVDGRGVRLAATIVRDVANTAASGHVSNIIQGPIAGNDYVCPVTPETRIPVLGTRKCVELLAALGDLEPGSLGDYCTINGAGLSPTAGEMAEAVRTCGLDGLGRITFEPDPRVMDIIGRWPKIMHFDRARKLGLEADESIDAIVADYLRHKGLKPWRHCCSSTGDSSSNSTSGS